MNILVRALFVLAVLVLSACDSVPQKPPESEPVQKVELRDSIAELLRQAERDLARDRLMQPLSGNAYDRFQAVLKLSPNHPQAISGVQQILIRYVELGRKALANNDIPRAQRMLSAARNIERSGVLLQELSESIALARSRVEARTAEEEYVLSSSDLTARNETIKTVLRKVAQRLRESDKSVLIVARNDSEGRWLYQTLRAEMKGARLRGDIRLEWNPRIVLLPPIF